MNGALSAPQTPRDSPAAVLSTALAVAFVCALVVSWVSVTLRPYYLANLGAERAAQLASIVAAMAAAGVEVDPNAIEVRVVVLEDGSYSSALDAVSFDPIKAARDPARGVAIARDEDLAGIGRRARHAVVYVVRSADSSLRALILPVYGSGYQSTLYGFVALDRDANTVLALKFYEQNETPGIGARIQEPAWGAQWPGKRVRDADGALRIGVARGPVSPSSTDAGHLVDGISGATRTSLGINGLLRFWLGDSGFGPYLARVREGRG